MRELPTVRYLSRLHSHIRPITHSPILIAGVLVGVSLSGSAWQTPASVPSGITAVPGIRVGHVTLTERPTGCTVILTPPNTVGGVDVRGGAPGTRETDVLAPENTVQMVNAVVLAGGSAYGLAAADGVMKYLEEKRVGYPVGALVVPIVPAAILFDLGVGGRPEIRPDASCGYQAATRAAAGAIEEGSVGAGAGATVGKLMGSGRAMKGGIGTASFTSTDGLGLVVGAIVAVNAVGTIVDPRTGRPVAGVRSVDGRTIEDPFAIIRRLPAVPLPLLQNTTIGVVATNARLTKAQARRIAAMAHDGMARAIVPSHTPSDGDTLFVLGTGGLISDREPNIGTIGAMAAEAVTEAILRAVRLAKGLPGFPAASEIR